MTAVPITVTLYPYVCTELDGQHTARVRINMLGYMSRLAKGDERFQDRADALKHALRVAHYAAQAWTWGDEPKYPGYEFAVST